MLICLLLRSPISVLEMATTEEWTARKHKPEEVIGELRKAEIVPARGGTVADACRRIGVTEQSYYRWRKQNGALSQQHVGGRPNCGPASTRPGRAHPYGRPGHGAIGVSHAFVNRHAK